MAEVLIAASSGQPSSIEARLQVLSLSAFELCYSMKRFLPDLHDHEHGSVVLQST